jgi:hypothetical protein
MKTTEVSQMIASVGLPYAYYQFPDNTPQAPPFIVFYYEDSDDLFADNSNYQRITELTIEFYSETKDFFYEDLSEDALTAASLTYRKSEQFIDSERMHETVYELEVLITQEENNG